MRERTRRTPSQKSLPRKQTERPTLCVDFDGVIHDYDPAKWPKMGLPKPGCNQALQELVDRGYRIVVWTSRASKKENIDHVRDWLDYYDIPYHDISGVKINAVAYIDDRGIRFETWQQTMEQIDLLLPPLMV